MRKAVIALGLFIFIPMLYQSFISTLLGRRVGSLRLFGGGVVGIVIALLWLPAMILVNFFPLGSVVLFGVQAASASAPASSRMSRGSPPGGRSPGYSPP